MGHLHDTVFLDNWRHTVKQLGWISHVEAARPTTGRGSTGGVAILHRPWITVLNKMQVTHPAICIALPIYTRGTGYIIIYSVYGHNQEQPQQLPQQTTETLDAISNHAKTH